MQKSTNKKYTKMLLPIVWCGHSETSFERQKASENQFDQIIVCDSLQKTIFKLTHTGTIAMGSAYS